MKRREFITLLGGWAGIVHFRGREPSKLARGSPARAELTTNKTNPPSRLQFQNPFQGGSSL